MTLSCEFLQGDVARLTLVEHCDVMRSGALRIATPFRYPDGSTVDLFLEQDADLLKGLTLSDHGQTTQFLYEMGVKHWATPRKREIVAGVCEQLEVSQRGEHLRIRVPSEGTSGIPGAIARLAQACIRIADLWYAARLASASTFKDSVEEFLSDASVDYEVDRDFAGPKGVLIHVDFTVKAPKAASLVNTLSAANPAAASAAEKGLLQRLVDLNHQGYQRDYQLLTIYDSTVSGLREADIDRLGRFSTAIFAFPAQEAEVRVALTGT